MQIVLEKEEYLKLRIGVLDKQLINEIKQIMAGFPNASSSDYQQILRHIEDKLRSYDGNTARLENNENLFWSAPQN